MNSTQKQCEPTKDMVAMGRTNNSRTVYGCLARRRGSYRLTRIETSWWSIVRHRCKTSVQTLDNFATHVRGGGVVLKVQLQCPTSGSLVTCETPCASGGCTGRESLRTEGSRRNVTKFRSCFFVNVLASNEN